MDVRPTGAGSEQRSFGAMPAPDDPGQEQPVKWLGIEGSFHGDESGMIPSETRLQLIAEQMSYHRNNR
jgi:hypothetical protein